MSSSLLLGALALTATTTATTATTATTTVAAPLVFENNIALDEDVYRAVLRLPPDAKADGATAAEIEDQLHEFLVRAGYEVALVDARVEEDVIVVFIDEGQLDKIVFPGQGTFRLVELRVAFDLPDDIFHRGKVERQLKLLEESYGYEEVSYRLIEVEDRTEHHLFRGTAKRHTLEVLLDIPEWQTGFGMEFKISFPQGLVGGFRYRGESIFFDEDRWEAKLGGSVRFQDLIQEEKERRFVSTGLAQLQWYTPPLFGLDLRPRFGLRTYYENRERLDLGLPSNDLITVDPNLSLSIGVPDRYLFSLGGGAEWRRVIDKVRAPDLKPHIDPLKSVRLYGSAELELVFDPDGSRRDRHDFVRLGGRYYLSPDPDEEDTIVAQAETQMVFELGFDELWIRTKSAGLFGRVAFPDDMRLSSFVAGIFGNKFFTQKAAALRMEYRYSLDDDYIKVSAIGDFAFYDETRPRNDPNRLGLAGSVGAGFHALVLTSFQFNISIATGFTRDGHAGFNIGAQLLRAF